MSQLNLGTWDQARREIGQAILDVTRPWDESLQLADILKMLERPPENIDCDFALPCFRFAKLRRMSPAQIAEELASVLNERQVDMISSVSSAGAFCNVTVNLRHFAARYFPRVRSGELFSELKLAHQPQKIMVEFSQPNTHKEFHVGHARNFCLGDAIVRILRFLGHEVHAVNYPGDEGTHIAKCLWYIRRFDKKPPVDNRGEWLGKMYVAANQCLEGLGDDEKQAAESEISNILAAIESKEGELYEQWQTTRQWSLDLFSSVYEKMNVPFDRYFFESEVSHESQELVEEYLTKGVFVEDDGAVGVDLKDEKLGFMIVRKRDGNTLYATKDLVLAKKKFEEFDIDISIYVVASEQNLHFKQVFRTLEKMGFAQAKNCYHLSYGMVTLPDGKMSSRKGNTISFSQLDEQMRLGLQQVLDKYRGQWNEQEISECQHRLSVGAIRYGMLATDPVKDVVFSMAEWLSFEGHSGPYLMYSYARTRSILEKARSAGLSEDPDYGSLSGQQSRELIKFIHDFNKTVVLAAEQYKPSILCHFLFDGCKAFNRFYASQSILKAETPEIAADRLALVLAFGEVLRQGLALLGVTPPERM